MIRMTERYLLGAVQLFDEHEPDELMGEDKGRERPNEIGALSKGIGDPICAANDENDTSSRTHFRLKMTRKGRGVEHFAALVEKHHIVVCFKPREYSFRLVLTGLSAVSGAMW